MYINPLDDSITKDDLIRVIKQCEQRLVNMSVRYRNLQTELVDEHKLWRRQFDTFMQRVEHPNHYAYDAEKMAQWLLDLHEALRPVLGIGYQRYGMRDLADNKDPDKKDLAAVAIIFAEILDYFDWDDK